LFEIVAVNEYDGSIELQHFDGTIEEVDPEDWISMRAEQTNPPEDWTGSVDINLEDFPDRRARRSHKLDWQSEIDALDDDLDGNDLIGYD